MGQSKAIASLVTGILAALIWPVSFVLGPVAIILGILVVRGTKNGTEQGKGMGIAGIVTGSIGLAIGLTMVMLAYTGVLSPTS